ncbi:EAL domain-containing protein [Cohnella soli]|uniref:EAL domain-containing protein n=1 Tax=Cohnella soli TaxID=425005 RepID=A0ABW0I0X8_9BACL
MSSLIYVVAAIAVLVLLLALVYIFYPSLIRRMSSTAHRQPETDELTRIRHAEKAEDADKKEKALYNAWLATQRLRRLQIEACLPTAIRDGQLTLLYEPQYELAGGVLRGVEAQLIFNHPELGEMPLRDFLRVAESTNMTAQISEWTIRQACEAFTRIKARFPERVLKLTINVTGSQLESNGFEALVKDTLLATDISPNQLELALTEGSSLSSVEAAALQVEALKAIGVRLALDKFGSTRHSTHFLRTLPFDTIKLVPKHVHDIGSVKERDMTGAMIGFFKHLGYTVVAEGLETYEQLTYLKKYKCDYAQGRLFGKLLQEDELSVLFLVS